MGVDDYISRLIQREGGFVDNPADRGSATKYGITKLTLQAFRGTLVSREDVIQLTLEEAANVYRELFFLRPHFDRLPAAIQEFMFDFGVNSGPPLAVKALQEIVGVKPDATIGPLTIAACETIPAGALLVRLIKWRLMMLTRIVRRDPSQIVFLGGWTSRCLSFWKE